MSSVLVFARGLLKTREKFLLYCGQTDKKNQGVEWSDLEWSDHGTKWPDTLEKRVEYAAEDSSFWLQKCYLRWLRGNEDNVFPVHSSIDFLWFLSMTEFHLLSSSVGNSLTSFEAQSFLLRPNDRLSEVRLKNYLPSQKIYSPHTNGVDFFQSLMTMTVCRFLHVLDK